MRGRRSGEGEEGGEGEGCGVSVWWAITSCLHVKVCFMACACGGGMVKVLARTIYGLLGWTWFSCPREQVKVRVRN